MLPKCKKYYKKFDVLKPDTVMRVSCYNIGSIHSNNLCYNINETVLPRAVPALVPRHCCLHFLVHLLTEQSLNLL